MNILQKFKIQHIRCRHDIVEEEINSPQRVNGDQPFQLHVPLGDETHVSRDDGALVHRESWIK